MPVFVFGAPPPPVPSTLTFSLAMPPAGPTGGFSFTVPSTGGGSSGGGGGGEEEEEGSGGGGGIPANFTAEEHINPNAHLAKRESHAAGALAEGETVSHTCEVRLKRFCNVKKSDPNKDPLNPNYVPRPDWYEKEWQDLDVGTFTITLPAPSSAGGAKCARWAFAPPASNPIVIARLDKYATPEAAPARKDGRPGGVKLTCMAKVDKSSAAQAESCVFLIMLRSAAEQEALLAALKSAKAVFK